MKILMLLMTILILCSCVKKVVVERCISIQEVEICRCHDFNFFKNKRVSESYNMPFSYCSDKKVSFNLEDWEIKIGPAINDLNRRSEDL